MPWIRGALLLMVLFLGLGGLYWTGSKLGWLVGSFRIIDQAQIPKKRVWPQLVPVLVLATLAGFLLGIVALLASQVFRKAGLAARRA